MKQKLLILLILSIALVGSVNAEEPAHPTYLNYDTSQSGHVLWSWSHAATGGIVDSYNVSVNSIWHNGSLSTSYDDNVGTGKTSHIVIYSYNNTGSGNLSTTQLSGSVRGVLRFNGISDVIQAIIPIFSSLIALVVAIVPYTIIVLIIAGLGVMLKKLFGKAL